ncbi:ABC-type transporter Mla maintaining outer membrane lipid asymmetry, periplasmic component MlaD [Mycobacterium rhizamassiliense]|uniref:ABC-type transporter Mla maintaining outer membrane lipid asymmetry, periplasmic component MlaD n=1 Tax=Mycobacterium rhizamassiliense TaxID=1841860 RepID=A0A2U3NU06_9MYCO|nr:ABC-type transporter Mla maintaining outer membrane lipid asymmetry, periplasmic component MlaD [Mycobacterium rhizamassiliense]
MNTRNAKIGLAFALVVLLMGGIATVARTAGGSGRTTVTGYFADSTGLYNGDDVVILGVRVGKVDKIEPQPSRVKITFWYDAKYRVPAEAKAVILSPSLVTPRSIQLTPAYTGGAVMAAGAVIPQERTAVPVEYDDLRQQLEKLTQTLQPTKPGGTSTLGAFINTAADNLRGQGPDIRDTLIKLSQAISAIGDHSSDLFSTLKNLSILVSALRDSGDVLRQLNQNLAAVTNLLANDPNEVGNAVRDLDDVADDVRNFVADNRETLGTTSDKLASVSQAVNASLDDVKQILHVAPTAFQNFLNIYQPAQGALTGALGVNQFANPIQFLCAAIQAASRRGAKESAKLCVQYLAPIFKNRQYNFPPLGENLFVGTTARPNEITYSEDWLRPDYVPPQPAAPPGGTISPRRPSHLCRPIRPTACAG